MYSFYLEQNCLAHHLQSLRLPLMVRVTQFGNHWAKGLSGTSSVINCPPLNWKVGCSIHGRWVSFRSTSWARVFTQNRPDRGQISGFGLSLAGVTKNSN